MAIDATPASRDDLFPKVRRTPLPGGYMGKLLRIDLTAGTCTPVELPEEPILRKFWGGQALGTYILLNELAPDVDAYSPESVITMMTGPVTGTGLTPGGTKMTAVYPSPATRTWSVDTTTPLTVQSRKTLSDAAVAVAVTCAPTS